MELTQGAFDQEGMALLLGIQVVDGIQVGVLCIISSAHSMT